MANAIAEGIRAEGAHADLFSVAEFGSRSTADYAKLALGCPSMGARCSRNASSSRSSAP